MQDHEAYQALPAKVAQWVLLLVDQNGKRCLAALEAWRADPSRFLGRPRLPGYKEQQRGRHLLVYTTQAPGAPALRQGVIAPSMLSLTVRTRQQNLQPVRSIPRTGCYVVEVI